MPHYLQQERALSDARFSPDQDHRTRNDPTAEHPVELPDSGVHPATTFDDGHLAQSERLPRGPRLLPRRPLGETDHLLRLAHLFGEGAPFTAVGAASEPLRRLMTAVRANVKSLRSHDLIVLDWRKSTATRGQYRLNRRSVILRYISETRELWTMQTRRTLRKVGGSMMLPIPPEMLEEMSLGPGQDAVLSSEGDVIQGGAVGTQALAGRRGVHGPVYEEI